MKKHLLSTLTLLLFCTTYSQVGINTDNPLTTLDIDGNLRISTRGNGANDDKVLTTSSTGIVNDRPISEIIIRKYRTTVTLDSGQVAVINNILMFHELNIFITSMNACNRNMITSFLSSNGAIIMTGGIARDRVGTSTIEPIPAGEPTYSTRLLIKFSNVLRCNLDGGNSNQFDFALKKLNNGEYEIRNDGNVRREFQVVWQEID